MTTQASPVVDLTERLWRTPVRAAMQLGLFSCSPDDPIEVVARTMAERSIHCVVVSNVRRRAHGGERLGWGIVSDLDLMAAIDTGGRTAGEIAGSEIVTISPRDPLAVAAGLMVRRDTAHLVVVSPETGRPIGLLSTLDVARAADGGTR